MKSCSDIITKTIKSIRDNFQPFFEESDIQKMYENIFVAINYNCYNNIHENLLDELGFKKRYDVMDPNHYDKVYHCHYYCDVFFRSDDNNPPKIIDGIKYLALYTTAFEEAEVYLKKGD